MKSKKEEFIEAWKRGVERGNSTTNTRAAVAERLREIRMQRGLSQKDIAELSSINHATYTGYENRISTPTIAVLTRIADVYGISLDYLAGRSESYNGQYVPSNEKEVINNRELQSRISAIEEELRKIKDNQ